MLTLWRAMSRLYRKRWDNEMGLASLNNRTFYDWARACSRFDPQRVRLAIALVPDRPRGSFPPDLAEFLRLYHETARLPVPGQKRVTYKPNPTPSEQARGHLGELRSMLTC